MRSIIIAAIAALAFASAAQAAPHCTKGKACGNTCIKATDVCHILPAPPKSCTTGKLCGNTCIAKTATCHKT